MLIVEHRVNTAEQLSQVPANHGIEIDVRASGDRLILAHNPYTEGEDLETFLEQYRHALIIFNTKCDGLEERILELTRRFGIESYFLLDTMLPTLVQMTRRGFRHAAIRFSEYEPIELALRFRGLVDWVWVDCFTRMCVEQDVYDELRRHFRICLVSPELQHHPPEWIHDFQRHLDRLRPDAVCTDYPVIWGNTQTEVHATEVSR